MRQLGSVWVLLLLGFGFSCGEKENATAELENQPAGTTELQFTEITEAAGIQVRHHSGAYGEFFMPEIMGGGAAFLDYNQDYHPDILLVGGGAWEQSEFQEVQSLYLFKNRGDGTFEDVSSETGLASIKAYAFGATIGDIDNDGDDDVYVTTLQKNLLLLNQNGRFVEVAQQAGVAGEAVWSTAAVWWDADRDGWLDLYVGNYLKWTPEMDRNIWCSLDGVSDNYCHPDLYEGESGVFYRNQGDGTFADETQLRGFVGPNDIAPIKTLGAATMDVDQDGWMDLVLANDMQADLLFHNRGDGTFEEVGTPAGMAYNRKGKARAGMGLVIGDLNNSGLESLIVGNFSRQPISVYQSLPHGAFLDRAYASQIGKPSFLTLTFGLSLWDVDLDGDQDVFAANGHVFTDIGKKAADISFRQPPHLFINDGTGVFQDQAATVGGVFQDSLVARASAVADIDADGDLDLLISENNGAFHLLRNDTRSNHHFVRLLLRTSNGNSNAVGAKVEIFRGDSLLQRKRVKTSEGYLSQSEFALTFGLGSLARLDSIRVTWPDQAVSRYVEPPVDQYLSLEAGKPAWTILHE
ncbi:MAG: CRTAC1 family protein [Bacteroidota bacterium]